MNQTARSYFGRDLNAPVLAVGAGFYNIHRQNLLDTLSRKYGVTERFATDFSEPPWNMEKTWYSLGKIMIGGKDSKKISFNNGYIDV